MTTAEGLSDVAMRIARLGIAVIPYTNVAAFENGAVKLVNALTGVETELPAAALVTVTARMPVDGLYEQLRDRWEGAGMTSLTRIGDCLAPSTIQQAVYTGHKWARQLDEAPEGLTPRELPMIESGRVKVAS